MQIHAFETGRLEANSTFLRGEGSPASLLRRARPVEFPVLSFVIEHPDGLIAVDTGLAEGVTAPRRLRGFPPAPAGPVTGMAELMRGRGLDPADVATVVLTHLDWDHTGGVGAFPRAEVLVHRREWEFAQTRAGRWRYRSEGWPAAFSPIVFDLDDVPHGPFPRSRLLAPGVTALPIPGHAPGQVALAVEDGDDLILFAADHMLRADWFAEDLHAGREVMLGAFARREARESTRRLARLVAARRPLLLPSHDADAPARLQAHGRRLVAAC